MKKYYLAYGSNLNVAQMQHRCPTARVVGTAEITNYELLFKGSMTGSYLTIEKADGKAVPVAVWEVKKQDELALDRYEGYPNFYYKKEMEIEYTGIVTHCRRKVKAFVYIMHEDRPLGIPSQYYVETCLTGYRTFDFDTKILYNAIYESKVRINENNKFC